MLNSTLGLIAPHYCYLCAKIGPRICDNCINYIEQIPLEKCLNCSTIRTIGSMCRNCSLYEAVFIPYPRDGVVKRCVDDYKFKPDRATSKILRTLLANSISTLPKNTILVPVPTIPNHIRMRGFDHTKLLAKELSRHWGVPCDFTLVSRTGNYVQHEAKSITQRQENAQKSFAITRACSRDNIYVIIDDIVTTGATTAQIAKLLHQAGAKHIWVVAVVYQSSKQAKDVL